MTIQHNLPLLLVHHLRKQHDSDPTNMLSGSTGLSGAVDGVYILTRQQRTENEGTLFCTGRDIESVNLALELDGDTHVWRLKHPNQREISKTDEAIGQIIDYLLTLPDGFLGTATQLAQEILTHCDLQLTPAVLRKKLTKYENILSHYGLVCQFKRNHKDKLIQITKLVSDVPPPKITDATDAPYAGQEVVA